MVPAQSEIETGPDGALILVVGGDRLALDANSRLILPAREPARTSVCATSTAVCGSMSSGAPAARSRSGRRC